MSKLFTVWVGGIEVNDYLLNKEEAEQLALEYSDYEGVHIEEIKGSN